MYNDRVMILLTEVDEDETAGTEEAMHGIQAPTNDILQQGCPLTDEEVKSPIGGG